MVEDIYIVLHGHSPTSLHGVCLHRKIAYKHTADPNQKIWFSNRYKDRNAFKESKTHHLQNLNSCELYLCWHRVNKSLWGNSHGCTATVGWKNVCPAYKLVGSLVNCINWPNRVVKHLLWGNRNKNLRKCFRK